MLRDKKRRRARRKRKKAAAQRRAVGERRKGDLKFIAWTAVVLGLLGAATALVGYWLARDSIVDHGMCFACMSEGPMTFLALSLGFSSAAVLIALGWRNVRKELDRC